MYSMSVFYLFFFCFGLLAILGTIFWVWMIIDCATNEPSQDTNKIVWILVIVLTHLVGAAIYFFVRRPERRRLTGR